jgi:GT2 family glycosyltransferase
MNGEQSLSIGVLVTNYNSWTLALNCVRQHLALHADRLSRVILLDDSSSTLPNITVAEAKKMGFDLIQNSKNLGFAATLNKGVTMMGTDIVLIFDADAHPLKPYFDILQDEFTKDSSLALLGMPTIGKSGFSTESFCPEPNIWSLALGQKLYAKTRNIWENKTSGICLWMCSMAVRTKAFEELGGFDEQFDLLDVDIDLCMRVNASTWRLKQHSDLLAFHDGGGTPMLLSNRLLCFYANRWKLLRKHRRIYSGIFFKNFILIRLWFEFIILRIFGKQLFPNQDIRLDKLDSRRRLLNYCKDKYC